MSIKTRFLLSYIAVIFVSITLLIVTGFLIVFSITGDFESVRNFYKSSYIQKPLTPEEEVKLENLEAIKKNFVFDNGMTIVNVPRLKTGATSTCIVPVTIQKPGTTYTVSYKSGKKETFEVSSEKIHVRQAKQVTNDTFEIESFLEDGVTDYANVIEAYKAGRGNQAFQLDENNKDKAGKQYQIISSLRDRKVTITTSAGKKLRQVMYRLHKRQMEDKHQSFVYQLVKYYNQVCHIQ